MSTAELKQLIESIAISQRGTDLQMKETDRKMQETDRIVKETSVQMKDTDRKMQETDRKLKELGKQINPHFPALRSGHRLFQRPSHQKQFPSVLSPK